MNPLEAYLQELHAIRSSGGAVAEASYYAPLGKLLNEVGKSLKPKVECVIQLVNRGAGNPDLGLYVARPSKKSKTEAPKGDGIPERGVIEAKPPGYDIAVAADSEQVKRYWNRYGLVLVTNYRQFQLIGRGPTGRAVPLESYQLAETEEAFWGMTAHPRKAEATHGTRIVEYLKRVLTHNAPITTAPDLAWFLASYARDAQARIEQENLPTLDHVRKALEEALGLEFVGDHGQHFFRSSLVQTLFYGVFSAWVLWHRENTERTDKFDWRRAGWSLHVPMIRALFEQVATPTQIKTMELAEPLNWAAATLDRVDRAAFFANFDQGQAVQYFYEPFLEHFDPQLRKDLGVWYTPPEIVQYMVARVDTALREELDIPDGLADPRVYVLDPCCGTGAYLVEVLKTIERIHREDKGWDALTWLDIKKAATERIVGFEIMPAPFVIAHLQLGMVLNNLNVPLDDTKNERVGVYLTNSLTGWNPALRTRERILFPEMEQERDAAERVKKDVPILVILGNPPYNAFAGVSPEEEEGLVKPYKEGLVEPREKGGWGIRKFNLDDLYVRFFRLAERKIAERTGQGIISFITNFSYLDDPSFVVMRKRFLSEFDSLWLDCMNGDSRETGKLTPEGKPDPSVFSTEYHPVGIRVGTAISLLVRRPKRSKKPYVRYKDFWGFTKRSDLLKSLQSRDINRTYAKPTPTVQNKFSLRPIRVTTGYTSWPTIAGFSAIPPFNGPVERRGNSLIRFEADSKGFKTLRRYLDPSVPDDLIRMEEPAFLKSSGEFKAEKARGMLKGKVIFDEKCIVRYPFKPLDIRLAYLASELQPLFSRPSPHLLLQRFPENEFLISRDSADKRPEGPPFFYSRLVCDYDCISGHARHFPFRIYDGERLTRKLERTLFDTTGEEAPTDASIVNYSKTTRSYLDAIRWKDNETLNRAVWMHVLAIGFSPKYLSENAEPLRSDWPRVPVPSTSRRLRTSTELGEKIAEYLDSESNVSEVTSGSIRAEMRSVARLEAKKGKKLDLSLCVGWGHQGKDNATMPGKGRVITRDYSPEEHAQVSEGAKTLKLKPQQILDQWGETTCDIYLNDHVFWQNIPLKVWEYVIGGYQVIKKWLSYREHDIIDRALTMDEAREVTNIARRIAALLLLQPELDRNYIATRDDAFDWSSLKDDS